LEEAALLHTDVKNNRAGYGCTTVAKLFELVHHEKAQGAAIDDSLCAQAKDFYLEALYK
jgi:hypothetical protein